MLLESSASSFAWNPVANNIMATISTKPCVKVWNIAKPDEPLFDIDISTKPFHVAWNYDGSLLAAPCDKNKRKGFKKKMLRVIDPRAGKVVAEAKCH